MKSRICNYFSFLEDIFFISQYQWKQFLIILVVAIAFIWMPQSQPIDWDLNIKNFWSNFPQTYLSNHNFVYPPWGLILLLPSKLIQATGTRVLSVITIGLLTYKREWPLTRFFAIVISPYFMLTMTKSNMDILVIVLPILIWEISNTVRWKSIPRGISLSLMLLKPQCTYMMILYLLWTNRRGWKTCLTQLSYVLIMIVPISFIGSPPLIFQWIYNISSPSPQNQYYWSTNNISMTANFGILISIGILLSTSIVIYILNNKVAIPWIHDQTISSLLLVSMFLSPYTSQQSLSSGLAFIPSWPVFLIQWIGLGFGFVTFGKSDYTSIWIFSIAILSLLISSLNNKGKASHMAV